MKRKDINELSDSEIADYIHSLDILRKRSNQNPNDENGYAFQAGLHNDVFIGPCEHGNDLFFAWHRAHLHYFEKLLQNADLPRTANVTIPYWDWLHPEASGKFPARFDTSGLFMSGRNNTATALPSDTLQIVTDETNWNAFGGYPKGNPEGDYGRLELGPHNYMHGFFIGGRMGDPSTAAEDAIYWSFHAFIDLLWAEWQRRNGMPSATSPDSNLRGFLGKENHKVRKFQKITDLDYEYDYTDKLKEAFGVNQPEPESHNLLTSEHLRPLFTDELPDELDREARAQYALPSVPSTTRIAFVRLVNLKVPTTGSYMLRGYLHPKDVPFNKDDQGFMLKYSVGYVALWKSHQPEDTHGVHSDDNVHSHHPTSCTVRFDVSKLLTSTDAELTSNQVLTLHYIPAPDSKGESLLDSGLIKEVLLDDVLLETYIQP